MHVDPQGARRVYLDKVYEVLQHSLPPENCSLTHHEPWRHLLVIMNCSTFTPITSRFLRCGFEVIQEGQPLSSLTPASRCAPGAAAALMAWNVSSALPSPSLTLGYIFILP